MHDTAVPSTAAATNRVVTPGGRTAKGGRGRDPAAHLVAPDTAMVPAAAAAPGRVVTPSGRRAKGGRGRDPTAYPTALHTVIATATAITRHGGGRYAPVA